PPLIWNMMMSMSGGWFFVVAAEAISVGNTTVTLPGVGAYIAKAIQDKNLGAIGWAIAAMAVVILIYDQLLFRPLTASADWFRLDQEAGLTPSHSWALTMMRRSRLLALGVRLFGSAIQLGFNRGREQPRPARASGGPTRRRPLGDMAWYAVVAVVIAMALWRITRFILDHVPLAEVGHVFALGGFTLLRVAILIALASAFWVPIGVYIGMRPRLARTAQPIAQFLAAFPANLLFPIVVSGIVVYKLNPNIWLSPLMVLGTQWYILFNVIVGASSLSPDLKYAGENLGVRGWLWWRKIALPAIFPFYLTGAITASGGSWNASVVAEVANWGTTHLHAVGLGAYIADATAAGDFPRNVLGIAVMSVIVVVVNRFFWRQLYARAERKFRLS
ncbi:MAG TPA: ABC transporter permease subunit, partial [Steroidobacteraceae bacterium]|nr:ABC transporter permease subunit [Steroidobacteraceae bacterium]